MTPTASEESVSAMSEGSMSASRVTRSSAGAPVSYKFLCVVYWVLIVFDLYVCGQ